MNGLDAFYDTGRVGIGTMTPDAALEVQSNDTDHTAIRIQNTQSSEGIYELRSIQSSGPINNGCGIWGGMEGFEDYRLVIKSNGKIGICFLDPKTKLSVNGTISAKAFASLSPWFLRPLPGWRECGSTILLEKFRSESSRSLMPVEIGSDLPARPRPRRESLNQVETDSFTTLVRVIFLRVYLTMTGGGNTGLGEAALSNNTTGNKNTAVGSMADVLSGNLSNALVLGRIAAVNFPGINVGIGTTPPTERLDVNGCIKHNNGTLGTGCSFDRRLKHEIKPLLFSEVLEKISGLSPVHLTSTWVSSPRKCRKSPELVGQKENGYLPLDYESIKWMTLQAVKELKAENDSLKARLARLEALLGVAE